ncbi:MAG: Tryptophan synthase alpha chain, partial [Myxococcaceae bacterium]|nr:Tryptophan synthase alpha chain [Myxococcaceae bacterium]
MSMVHRLVLGLAFATAACSGDADSAGSGGLALSHSSTAPGQTGNTPGQSGQTPGQGGTLPPGQGGTTPGQSRADAGTPPTDLCVGVSCDDSNPCTTDSCDPASGCAHADAADGTVVDATPTSCGVGPCAATGQTVCSHGAAVDSCRAGAGAASDATCDGVDDDCDGRVDEDYAPVATSCGAGACAAMGTTSCAAGAVVDSCTAGGAASSDATCNGIDDDCDGRVDDDFVPTATSCGVGPCGATGSTSCLAGAVVDSCRATAGAASDATCNGVDDDCDGATDEDYAPVAT